MESYEPTAHVPEAIDPKDGFVARQNSDRDGTNELDGQNPNPDGRPVDPETGQPGDGTTPDYELE